MDFIKFESITEGRYFHESYISMGRIFQSSGRKNGWYVCIKMPFTKIKDYIDPFTFRAETGLCRLAVLFSLRVIGGPKELVFFESHWEPENN